ncbi:ATP-binding protein [Chloroflexota bacterium]
MEHIGEILRRTQINISRENMDTWSSAETEEESSPSAGCDACNGAGFVHPLLPSGKPDFSRVVACRCAQQSTDKERYDNLLHYSNLGPLTRFTFDNVIPESRSGNPMKQERFQHSYEVAKAFAANPEGWLVLVGPSGCGKTHLAAAIVNERIKNGKPALFVSIVDLLDRLRSTFSPDSDIPYDEFFNQVRNAPLLVLDDFGVQSSTPWVKEKLDQLLNYRFNNELPTVIVTALPVEQLEDRMRTRLADPRLSRVYQVDEKQIMLEYGWRPEFELQKSMTFDQFQMRVNLTAEQRQNLEAVFHLAMDFAKSPEGWLVFMGVTGCGKTHLAAAIANYRYQAKQPALFIVVPEFLDHLRSTFNPDSKVSYDQLFETVKLAPLLIMDDFGEQSTTPWAREKLYQVINYRYNARLATVITTRYSLQEILEEIEGSVSSRLVDPKISTPFNIIAPDYRGDSHPETKKSSSAARGKRYR